MFYQIPANNLNTVSNLKNFFSQVDENQFKNNKSILESKSAINLQIDQLANTILKYFTQSFSTKSFPEVYFKNIKIVNDDNTVINKLDEIKAFIFSHIEFEKLSNPYSSDYKHDEEFLSDKFIGLSDSDKSNYFRFIATLQSSIPDKQLMMNLINKVIEKDAGSIAVHIKDFKINDQKTLIYLAKECAQRDGFSIALSIKNFGIKDPSALIDIAKLCAKQDGASTALYIENFDIKDLSVLLEIAMLCAQCEQALSMLKYIKNFNIIKPSALNTIINLCIKNQIDSAKHIQNLVKDPIMLLKLAYDYAKKHGSQIFHYIDKFNIKNENELAEIVKSCIQTPESIDDLGKCIKQLNIKSEKLRIEIAEIAIQKGPWIILCLSDFNIKDEEALANIAKIGMEVDTLGIAKNISSFNIKDKKLLTEIFKFGAQQDGSIATYIQRFKITDKSSLIEGAKLCAEKSPVIASYIKSFNIQDENVLVEIAKLCAQQDGVVTAKSIKNFGIQDKNELFEIAKLCAINNGNMIQSIKDFGIKDKQKITEIAQICSEKSSLIIDYLKEINIKDEKVLIDIAKNCALLKGAQVAKNMNAFGIQDEDERVKIAKLCVYYNGLNTLPYIQNFGIKNLQALFDIAELCATRNPETIIYIKNFNLQSFEDIGKIFTLCLMQSESVLKYSHLLESQFIGLESLMENNNENTIKENLKNIFKLEDEFYFKSSPLPTHFLISALLFLNYYVPNENKLIFKELIESLLDYRSPDDRMDFIVHLRNPPLKFKEAAEYPNVKKLEKQPFYKLLRLMLTNLSDNKEEIISFYKPTWNNVLLNYQTFSLFIDNLRYLAQSYELSDEDKQQIFKHLMELKDKNQIKEDINAMHTLFNFGMEFLLLEKNWAERANEVFKTVLPLGNISNFDAAYDKFFLSSRQPQALVNYTATLSTLRDLDVMESLGVFVTHVLNNNFKNMRYKIEYNEQLEMIDTHYPNLLEVWKKETVKELTTYANDDFDLQSFDFHSWLKQVLVIDQHLPELFIKEIKPYLENGQPFPQDIKYKGLTKRLQNILEHDNKQHALKAIQKELQKMEHPPEFLNDVKELLKKFSETVTKGQLVETDNYMDLLLCGTEVSGSCQKINGNPDYNKGLLGYLLDGKIRLLAIKYPNGQIKSRCLLKLMWDGDQPVLLQERIYPQKVSDEDVKLLTDQAKQKARELKIPLVVASDNPILALLNYPNDFKRVRHYPKVLQSLGGPAPFEYSDAGELGIQENGCYEIQKSYYVN